MADAISRILAVAQRQHAVFTRAQALEAGVHRRAIDREVAARRWEILARGVFRVVGSQRTWEQRALALSFAAGDDTAVSHRSAGHVYGLDGFGPTGRIDITAPRHQRRKIVGARFHESLDPHLLDIRTRRGVPVTGPARTVLDICAVVDDDLDALAALDEMLRLRFVTWPQLWDCLVLHARRGRNGVARFRRILQRRWGKRVPRGQFVRMLMVLLADAGLPEPTPEYPVRAAGVKYFLDLAYPELKVSIELDDKGSHLTDAAFETDPVRENRLKLEGWLVLRYTSDRVLHDPNGVLDEIRQALAARSCAA